MNRAGIAQHEIACNRRRVSGATDKNARGPIRAGCSRGFDARSPKSLSVHPDFTLLERRLTPLGPRLTLLRPRFTLLSQKFTSCSTRFTCLRPECTRRDPHSACSGSHSVRSRPRAVCSGPKSVCSGPKSVCSGPKSVCSGSKSVCSGPNSVWSRPHEVCSRPCSVRSIPRLHCDGLRRDRPRPHRDDRRLDATALRPDVVGSDRHLRGQSPHQVVNRTPEIHASRADVDVIHAQREVRPSSVRSTVRRDASHQARARHVPCPGRSPACPRQKNPGRGKSGRDSVNAAPCRQRLIESLLLDGLKRQVIGTPSRPRWRTVIVTSHSVPRRVAGPTVST